jgi:two-component system chemotaxis response regulator CheY
MTIIGGSNGPIRPDERFSVPDKADANVKAPGRVDSVEIHDAGRAQSAESTATTDARRARLEVIRARFLRGAYDSEQVVGEVARRILDRGDLDSVQPSEFKMRFLVVDDSATMRRILVNSLQRIGFADCVEAGDGRQALEKFDSSVSFVITDWNMPTMSGIDFARALRAQTNGKTVPILMVTTRSDRDDIIAAVEAGVNNYIVKPFTPHTLKEKIDQVLSTVGALASSR